ncbi:HD-GYP domain-containing protein [Ammoniphilus sp. YIM 78166]|uniref:HD-GYP domain-containing protein n=1 Tax=Ammoniphilus sp. YIM 78166 TaxID=1644106 RepID=UPI0014305A15|nr:HD domain-containing phosphohydrolase [Ammoniphilus sp. YIM 78166]
MKKLLETLKKHHSDTYEHCIRVAGLSLAIAKAMSIHDKEQQQIVYYGGLLHDIGKLKISKDILSKPGKLSFEEWSLIQKHPIFGYELSQADESIHHDISYTILFHHERINGKGYPFGISGDAIPLSSQIVAVADSFDAMTNHRSYQKEKSPKEALDVIIGDKGTLFSTIIVKKLIEVLNK